MDGREDIVLGDWRSVISSFFGAWRWMGYLWCGGGFDASGLCYCRGPGKEVEGVFMVGERWLVMVKWSLET